MPSRHVLVSSEAHSVDCLCKPLHFQVLHNLWCFAGSSVLFTDPIWLLPPTWPVLFLRFRFLSLPSFFMEEESPIFLLICSCFAITSEVQVQNNYHPSAHNVLSSQEALRVSWPVQAFY